jgi:hypothetical protein
MKLNTTAKVKRYIKRRLDFIIKRPEFVFNAKAELEQLISQLDLALKGKENGN